MEVRKGNCPIRVGCPEEDDGYLVKYVPADIYGSFAVHRKADGWSITHVPTGLTLANRRCFFKDRKAAIAAMVEIEGLYDNWATFTVSDEQPNHDLAEKVARVGKSHGGEFLYSSFAWRPVKADLEART